MGFFDLFKKDFWKDSKKLADQISESENIEQSSTVKTSFLVGYKLVFKDVNDMSFDKKPCYKSKLQDGSENDCTVCKKLIELDRFYSRAEIETISQKLGYSVFDNPGGAVDENGYPICACKWESSVVIKK